MKRYLILLGATLVGGALFAQPRVIGVHPAHDGKLLTMEEAAPSIRRIIITPGSMTTNTAS